MKKEFVLENEPLEFALLYCNLPDSSENYEIDKYVPRVNKQYDHEIDFEGLRRQMNDEVSFKLIIK